VNQVQWIMDSLAVEGLIAGDSSKASNLNINLLVECVMYLPSDNP